MENLSLQIAVVASALDTDPRRAASSARANGFAGVQFDAGSSQIDLTELSQTGRREFRQMLASNNVALASLRADLAPKGLGAGVDIDRLLARMTKVMEAAKALVAPPLLCINLGPLPEPPPDQKAKPKVTPEQTGLIIIPELSAPAPVPQPPGPAPDPLLVSNVDAALRELGTLADRMGMTVALRSDLASFAALDRAITAAGCPWFGIDLDPVAMLSDAWESGEIFSRFGPLIRHVRGRDAVAGSGNRTQPAVIGRGSVDWSTLGADLEGAGYRGWLTIDSLELPDRLGAAVEGEKFLRSIAQ